MLVVDFDVGEVAEERHGNFQLPVEAVEVGLVVGG